MNDWVLITGASSGIGRELAKSFAADGFNLVLVARNQARLQQLAAELTAGRGIQTRVLVSDLADSTAPRAIFEAVQDLPISVLVNNAGFGLYGPFVESDIRLQTQMMQVNMTALVELSHLFARPMIARRAGRILNVGSMGGFMPGPLVSVYFASKAFVYSFSRALAVELAPSGVQVSVLCPGTTDTEFFRRGNFGPHRAPFTMSAGAVAAIAHRGLLRGRRVVIPGWINRLAAGLARHAPEGIVMRAVRRLHARGK